MFELVAIYRTPKNPDAFNHYCFSRHVPGAKTVPGLRRYQTNDGPIGAPLQPGSAHLIAELDFDSLEAVQAAFASPQGRAAVADIANFADGGHEFLVFKVKEV